MHTRDSPDWLALVEKPRIDLSKKKRRKRDPWGRDCRDCVCVLHHAPSILHRGGNRVLLRSRQVTEYRNSTIIAGRSKDPFERKKWRRIGQKFIENLHTFKLFRTRPLSRNRFCISWTPILAAPIWRIGLPLFDYLVKNFAVDCHGHCPCYYCDADLATSETVPVPGQWNRERTARFNIN